MPPMKKPNPNRRKQPWQKPVMQTAPLYERQALACGKNDPRQHQCFRRATVS
jgi:hypothetical protein